MRIRLGAAGLIAAALGGCATNFVGDPLMAPAKFQFLRCEDIAKRLVAAQNKEKEVQGLMERADSGVGGSAVNLFVYSPDLQNTQSELRQLREAAGEKRCSDEPAKVAPKPDAAPPPRR
jgi:hypothetical protein